MMTQNKFLKEAIRIGDDILARKEVSEHGFYWKTMSLDTDKKITWQISESIYSGVGGIVLFFIELYKQTGDKKYLEAAEKGSDWLIHHVNSSPTDYYAFFTGRMGLTYVFTQIYQLIEMEKFLNEAVRIALHSTDFLNKKDKVDDLINGTSGSLLGLLLLHSITGEEKLLPIMNRFTGHLLESFHIGPEGIYWDKNSRQIRGLCGFSHGASGVGYVFLQLGFYFNNPSFYWIAEHAFAYENYYFDEKTGNWPDFRKGIFSESDFAEQKQAWLNQNFDFFYKPGNMMAWCHGAPGIGLSRLQAWKRLKKDYLRKDLENSLESTRRATLTPLKETDTFTLCHGKGGNAMLFLEAYKHSGNEETHSSAQEVASQALDFRNKYGYYLSGFNTSSGKQREDLSLFMGNAGIGYFYLMCRDPENVLSILAPGVNEPCKMDVSSFDILGIPLQQIRKKILAKAFPRTVLFLENNLIEINGGFGELNDYGDRNLKEVFISKIKKKESDDSIFHNKSYMQDLLGMEETKLQVETDTNSSLQNIKSIILKESSEKLLALPDNNLMKTKLKLNEDVYFYKSKWNLPEVSSDHPGVNPDTDEKPAYYLFLKSSSETHEYKISPLVKDILFSFKSASTGETVTDKILAEYEILDKEEEAKLNQIIVSQINECVCSLFLVEV